MSRRSAVVALGAAYAALAVLVATGAVSGIDQWSVDHAMQITNPRGSSPSLLEAAVPLYHAHSDTPLHVAAAVVTLPAQAFVSLAILLALRRIEWIAAWFLGNVVEVICKWVIVRPPLHHDGVHLVAFDSSFASGHTLRSIVLAAALAAAWPRARWAFAAWAAASLALLEAAGHHVPTDIAGGTLLAGFWLALVAGGSAGALRGRGLRAAPRRARR